jgi:hypothetical protein
MRFRSLALVVLLLAFAFRITALGDQAVWWDEAWSVQVAQESLGDILETSTYDSLPPLHAWTLAGWIRVAGISEFAIRYIAALWGWLTVALVYSFGVRLGGRRAGLLAAYFLGLSAFHIALSQDSRMYAMAGFFVALTTYAYVRLRADPLARDWWGVLVLASITLALTHYLGLFALAILNLHWLLTWRTHTHTLRRRWIAAMLLTGGLLALWGLYVLDRVRGGGGESGVALDFVFQLTATLWAVGSSVNLDHYLWLMLIVMLVLGWGLALYARRNWPNALLIGLMALVPPLVIYLLSQPFWRYYSPAPQARYFVMFAPVVYAGFGLALDALRVRWRALGMLAALALTGIYGAAYLRHVDSRYFRDDYASLFRMVDLLAAPDEPVFFVSDDRYPLVYYHLDRAAGGQTPLRVRGIPLPADDLDARMRSAVGDSSRFWFVEIERGLSDPEGASVAWLDAHYERVLRVPIDYNAVTLYAKTDLAPPASTEVLPPVIREARPGDTVRIGVPDGTWVDLIYGGRKLASQVAEDWSLLQFSIYETYPPGKYGLRTLDSRYTFRVTHSQPTPDDPPRNVELPFGPLRLLGYSIDDGRAKPGETFEITLYWQVDESPTQNYTVFFHLLGPENPADGSLVWATDDGYPADTPTRALWAGQTMYDRHRLRVPDTMPPGWYSVEIGLYVLETDERLTLPDGADRVLIPGLEVR